jgi:hypothetical protein
MARRSVPELPRVCGQCGRAWVQRDGQAPRDFCSTTCWQEAAGRPQRAAAPEAVPVRTWTRVIRAQEHTITCTWCGALVTVEQYPGPAPRYCSPACRQEAARDGAATRMRRMRERRRQEAVPVTDTKLS